MRWISALPVSKNELPKLQSRLRAIRPSVLARSSKVLGDEFRLRLGPQAGLEDIGLSGANLEAEGGYRNPAVKGQSPSFS